MVDPLLRRLVEEEQEITLEWGKAQERADKEKKKIQREADLLYTDTLRQELIAVDSLRHAHLLKVATETQKIDVSYDKKMKELISRKKAISLISKEIEENILTL